MAGDANGGRARPSHNGMPAMRKPRRNPAQPFGRRRTDLDSREVATRKLVVATVVLVDALYLAGDALLNGSFGC